MKGTPLTILSLIFSVTTPRCLCEEYKNVTMIYAVGNQVFTKKLSGSEEPRLLTSFKGDVTGLAIDDNYLYASHRGSSNMFLSLFRTKSKIWRVKISTSSESIKLLDNTWKEFNRFNEDDENEEIVSMAVAEGHIYSGSSRRVIYRCWADVTSSCLNFDQSDRWSKSLEDIRFSDGDQAISTIEYNPADNQIYAVESYEMSRSMFKKYVPFVSHLSWHHRLWRCSPIVPNSCTEVLVRLDGWATFHVAFEAFWLSNRGHLWKCPLNRMNETSGVSYQNCLEFNDFNRPVYVSMGSSKKYLYLRLEGSNQIWNCDPITPNSCTQKFELAYDTNIGPFVFV